MGSVCSKNLLFFYFFTMQRKSLAKSIFASLALVAVLAGCAAAPAPEKPAEEVLKEGLANLAEVSAYSYDVAVKGDLTDPYGEKMNFDVKLNGQLDSIDEKDPKLVLQLDGTATDSTGTGGSGKAELRMNKENLYFNIMSLNLKGDVEELPSDVTDLFGKWWMMPLPEGTFDEIDITLSPSDEAEQAELKKSLEQLKLFATPEYKGTENVMGESSYHYRVNIDKKGLLEFAKSAAEAEGETISAAEMAEAEEELKNVDINGDVWVGVESGVLNQFKGSITMKESADQPSGTITVSVAIGNVNKPVTIQAPADAEEFPMEQLLGPMMMMGGGIPGGDADLMMDDSFMMDESMMMDEAMTDEELEELMKDLEELEGLEGMEGLEGLEELELDLQ